MVRIRLLLEGAIIIDRPFAWNLLFGWGAWEAWGIGEGASPAQEGRKGGDPLFRRLRIGSRGSIVWEIITVRLVFFLAQNCGAVEIGRPERNERGTLPDVTTAALLDFFIFPLLDSG